MLDTMKREFEGHVIPFWENMIDREIMDCWTMTLYWIKKPRRGAYLTAVSFGFSQMHI